LRILTFTAAILLAAASNLSAAVIYGPTVIGSSARISEYGDTTQFGFRSFDNFSFDKNASIETVTWYGFWIDLNNPVPAPAPAPDVQNWEIAFYGDNAGTPGAQLSSETIAPAGVTTTVVGAGTFTVGDTYNVVSYRFATSLVNPFSISSGTDYWFSIFARSDDYYPAFTWLGATGGDDASYQHVLGAGLSITGASAVARDRAAILEGTVPEPPAAILMGMTLLLLPLARRFRFDFR
jgi:hypothetical protein